jgi:putative transposase
MRKRFTEEQIIKVVKELESGQGADNLARKYGVHVGTIYSWRSKFGGMEISDAKRLRSLEQENGRLKKLVAEQALDIQILKEVNSKNW